MSVRHFVYGPGDGGLTTEYLHASPSSPEGAKRLLTRQGGVTNLGANLFELSFPSAFKEFEVSTNEKGIDALKTGVALEGGAERESAREILRARTTYLSERMWIIRGVDDPSKVAAFVRTETRSVIDRRGLVAEGQLKPPEDEQVRYGGLLFGESLSDYYGWEKKAGKEQATKDKLLRN